jgi:hypothetical protein
VLGCNLILMAAPCTVIGTSVTEPTSAFCYGEDKDPILRRPPVTLSCGLLPSCDWCMLGYTGLNYVSPHSVPAMF